MHQIFYIDIDEEITSVIDRLRKSKTTENFFVVSPRSLILQSVVSLRLLKREATNEKKQIAIVVNDKEASMKVEKAGILVLDSLKGLDGGEEIKESFSSQMEIKDSNNNNKYKNVMEKENNNKKSRLQKIGSDSFYDDEENKNDGNSSTTPVEPVAELASAKNIRSSSDMIDGGFTNPSKEPSFSGMDRLISKNTSDINIRKEKTAFSYAPEASFEEPAFGPRNNDVPKEYGPNRIGGIGNMDPYKEKLVEGFFNPESKKANSGNQYEKPKENTEKSISVPHRMRKIIFSFSLICFLIALGIGAYVFLPKADILVTVRSEVKKFDLNVKADENQKEIVINELSIPGKIIEKEDSITETYKATGEKESSAGSSQKAKGKVTIYNNYNKEPQQLVATTRVLSTDGKLFRLVKGVTVSGMNGSDPGTVEADVIADKSGEEYNIDPSEFKIPGFEGTPKYDKFYAKSSSAMNGGGAGGSSEITIVSQSDLDSAKKDSEAKMKEKLEQIVKDEIGSGNVFLPDASEETILESSFTARANEVASSFDVKVKGKIKVIVFSENDLKKMAGDIYNEANKEKAVSDYSLISINYGVSSSDFTSKKLSIKANAEVPIGSDIDWDQFKKDMLGKNDAEIKEILKNYPQIEKINIDFWPNFISQKIPQYEKRVEIKVESEANEK